MKSIQTSIKSFLSRDREDSSDEDSVYTPTPMKSALKIPDQWTRIVPLARARQRRMRIFDITKDLETDRTLKQIRKGSVREQGSMIFDPQEFEG